MYEAAPPIIFPVDPNGVSIASNATEPITNKLMKYFFVFFLAKVLKIMRT
jgi:hypothetical protein